ncbi:coiled-coil domain-containing protein 174 [Rhipicephalus sanguineus]|uniref:coiled-coil domain-containing protein 174 n=1 Tax=Rhipicephalus sanguineus TaxID=34632 RepID=UPI001894D461|nr:coiled-coil domain-containing protein 174 [Rhipicephalus sanguineus]
MEGSNKKGTFGKVSLGASVSSLIDLKAELLRKREALKVQKLKQFQPEDGYVKQKLILGSDSGAATKKEPPKKTPEAQDIPDEDADLKRSRAALQRKAKLYEKLSSGKVIPGDEEASLYVVNFQRKAMDAAVEERERRETPTVPTKEEAGVYSKDDSDADDNVPSADHEALDKSLAGTEEEWVDYTDALGRSRRCMRKDLPALIDNDKELTGKSGVVEADIPERTAQFLAYERTREQLRQQWQDQEAENAYKESLHYGDVRFQEAREHGVGFYDLSGDSAERQKQLDMLNKLRDQTEKQKEISRRMKEKRKAMLEARLARIRQKKNIPDDKPEEQDKDSSEDETEQVDTNSNVPDRPKIIGDSDTLEVPEMRPWDEGKNLAEMVNDPHFRKKKLSQEDWVDLQRQERPTEFAPPSAYRSTPGPKKAKYSNFTRGQTQFGANVDTSGFQETDQAPQQRHLQSSAFEDMIAQRLAEARRASEQQSPWGGPF